MRDVEYESVAGTMRGRLALPDGDGVRPAVLIAHEGPGLDNFQRDRAGTFAELGYVAFALDYHGDGRMMRDMEEMVARLDMLRADVDQLRAIGRAGLGVLLAEPRADASRVAAVGYCFGGNVVLELARDGADLQAVVAFHPGLTTVRPEDARNITAKVLACVGTGDPLIAVESRAAFEAEMDAAGVDWRMILYGGIGHSFTHPKAARQMPGLSYDELTDRRSWRAMLDLFDEVF
jgi:dienelactone hydrolase